MSSVFAFSAARLAAYCATIFSRFLFRLIWLCFAIRVSPLVHKWKLEALKKRFRFRVGLRRRVDDDIHTPHGLGLVVVDFDEDDVFLEVHGKVPPAVKASG